MWLNLVSRARIGKLLLVVIECIEVSGRGVTANILGLGPSDSGFESRQPEIFHHSGRHCSFLSGDWYKPGLL